MSSTETETERARRLPTGDAMDTTPLRRSASGRHRIPDAPALPAATSRFRPELEGLRALASLLVVIYHVWIGRVSGGVDVFFLVSGFLLTGQLVRAAERGRIDLRAYWGKTFRRLVPTTTVVLVGCVAAGVVLLPESRWPQTIREVVASAFFVQNWRLGADSVDYYAAHDTASVVQHLWSLSIQGQFYLVFPLAIVAVVLLARRLGLAVRPAVLAALLVGTAASLVYSVVLTATDQQLAYFHSLTRLWEFTLGGLLALLIGRVRLPSPLRVVLGWTGVLALVSCGLVLDVEGGFPGYLALWPVLAGGLVLLAERTDGRFGVDRVLASGPMQYLGRISFPLYLWHWPVLLFALVATGRTAPGLMGGLAVVAVSLVLAALTARFVEEPVRRARIGRSSPWGDHRVALAALLPILVLALAWHGLALVKANPAGVVGDADHPGAMAREPGYVFRGNPEATAIPAAVSAYEDWVDYRKECSAPPTHPDLELCTYVQPSAPDAPTIVVAGDSHMQQFLPAVAPIARERGWRVLTMIRPGCPFSITSDSNIGEVECVAWNQAAIAEITSMRPAAVVAEASRNVRVGRTEETPPGFVEAWRALADADVPVLAVRDNPRFGYPPPSCVDTYGRHADQCLVPRADLYAPDPPFTRDSIPSNVSYLDLSDSLCTEQWCPPEIGNVVVYLDDNHVTATFSASLAPVVGSRIAATVRR